MTDPRKSILKGVKRVIIKVGSRVLTDDVGRLNNRQIKRLSSQIDHLGSDGYEVIIVSSGAVAAGREMLGVKTRELSVSQKQAAAAIGQISLVWSYRNYLGKLGRNVAQILLTHEDFRNRERFLNARTTLFTLLKSNVIPIINENDSVSVDEIKFGDNDNLAALVTNMAEADLLIMLTDTDGLYNADPREDGDAALIPLVTKIDKEVEKLAEDTPDPLATGGMTTKVRAAKKVAFFGVPTIVANGKSRGVLLDIFSGKEIGTLFLHEKKGLSSRKQWIAFSLKPHGEIIVDNGGMRAVAQRMKSLLPSGISNVGGAFSVGDMVRCVDKEGKEFARGLVSYSSDEIRKIMGKRSDKIKGILGYKYSEEVIHRDDMVVMAGGK